MNENREYKSDVALDAEKCVFGTTLSLFILCYVWYCFIGYR